MEGYSDYEAQTRRINEDWAFYKRVADKDSNEFVDWNGQKLLVASVMAQFARNISRDEVGLVSTYRECMWYALNTCAEKRRKETQQK